MCAPPFRRDCAMASDTIAKLCSPADQSDSLVSVLRIFFCVSFEYPAAFQDNLITWPIKKRRESDGGSDMVEHGD
jgi:hypothetical protein